MGLDNGIILRFKENAPRQLVNFVRVNFKDYDEYELEYDLLYWRKCRNIREAILVLLDRSGYDIDGECEWTIDIDTFECILDKLRNRCYRYNWWNKGDSIWEWIDITDDGDDEGIASHYWSQLCMCYMFLGFIKSHPEYQDYCIIQFYDSY